jgi:heme exporter protein D
VSASLSTVFHSTAFTVAEDLVLFCIVVLWLGVAYWVYRDARRRIDGPLFVWSAVAVGLVPVVGPLAYLLVRPPETLADRRSRRIELRAIEQSLERHGPRCPVCRTSVEAAFLVCPVCTAALKEPCGSCEAPLEPLWQVCPYCTAPVRQPVAADLDAALTAEAGLKTSRITRAKRPRRVAAS